MKTPRIRRFEKVRFCSVRREECAKLKKTKKGCGGTCVSCGKSEEIYQRRFT